MNPQSEQEELEELIKSKLTPVVFLEPPEKNNLYIKELSIKGINKLAAIILEKYVRRDRIGRQLAHANGALCDIITLVTSCVERDPRSSHKKITDLAKVILGRILSSSSMVWNKPSWYIHSWEKQLYKDYFSGKIRACASPNKSSYELAKELKGIATNPEVIAKGE